MEFNMKKVKVGTVVEGKVFMVTDDSVHIDLGAYAEGVIYKKAMSLTGDVSCKELVKEGDVITAKVNKMDDEYQQILLSRIDILREELKGKHNVEMDSAEKFSAKVVGANSYGLELKYQGIDLFMPASHIDLHKVNPEDFKGLTLEVCVIERNSIQSCDQISNRKHKRRRE